jgi:antitoxin component YwqK of YwqJK toxin-antitoxin module
MMSYSFECKAITKSRQRCKRNATIDGYCKQHFEIHEVQSMQSVEKKENVQGSFVDLMKYGFSDYVKDDKLKELGNQTQIKNSKRKSGNITYDVKETYINNVLREKKEFIKNKLVHLQTYNEKGNLDGITYVWDTDGKLKLAEFYDNGQLLNIIIYKWSASGKPKEQSTFDEKGYLNKVQIEWDNDGNIISQKNYVHGVLQE